MKGANTVGDAVSILKRGSDAFTRPTVVDWNNGRVGMWFRGFRAGEGGLGLRVWWKKGGGVEDNTASESWISLDNCEYYSAKPRIQTRRG